MSAGHPHFRTWRLFVGFPERQTDRCDVESQRPCLAREEAPRAEDRPPARTADLAEERRREAPCRRAPALQQQRQRRGCRSSPASALHTAFQIFVKGKNGKSYVLWMKSLDTVDDIKHKIELKDGTPVKEQRLVFNGREMLGDRSFRTTTSARTTRSSWCCVCAAAARWRSDLRRWRAASARSS